MERVVKFITLGCKVNQYETNAMTQKFIEKGYKVIEENSEEKPDICIINTCTVTNMSDRKSRQMLRRVKEKNEKTVVVAVGCYAQIAKEEILKLPEIDLVLGNNEKVIELLEKIIQILVNLSFDFNLYIDSYELNKRLEKIKNKNRFATNGG